MLKFVSLDTGFTFYIYRFREVPPHLRFFVLGNVCDYCNSEYDKGFLFPVLNYGLCLNCAKDFLKRNKDFVYEEDRWFMDAYIAHFQSFLPVTDISHCTDLGWVLKQYQGY